MAGGVPAKQRSVLVEHRINPTHQEDQKLLSPQPHLRATGTNPSRSPSDMTSVAGTKFSFLDQFSPLVPVSHRKRDRAIWGSAIPELQTDKVRQEISNPIRRFTLEIILFLSCKFGRVARR